MLMQRKTIFDRYYVINSTTIIDMHNIINIKNLAPAHRGPRNRLAAPEVLLPVVGPEFYYENFKNSEGTSRHD